MDYKIFIIIISVLLILTIFIITESFRENRLFNLTKYKIKDASLNLRICLLSDLHGNDFGDNYDKIVLSIKNMKPDLILITGDLITSNDYTSYKNAYTLLEKISKEFDFKKNQIVFYSLGNHESKARESNKHKNAFNEYINKCKKLNINILDNEKKDIICNLKNVSITGLTINNNYYNKFEKNFITKGEIDKLLNIKLEKDRYNICLSHHPCTILGLSDFDLVLSGHYHGGLVRLPFIGGLITPQLPKKNVHTKGMYKIKDTIHIISSGLGWHTIPLRLFNKCELVFIEIKNN